MGHYLHLANVAVLPSLWEEPFGLTCAEALAARLPVITTRQGGIPEVVNEECAILLDATEELPHHLAEAILDLYHHPERRQAMSNAARCRSQLFSKQRYAQEFFKALEQVK
jgi:glycosyltransferase involved in cell wall biosynthesis